MKIANLIFSILSLAVSAGMFILYYKIKRGEIKNANIKGRYRYIVFGIVLLIFGLKGLTNL